MSSYANDKKPRRMSAHVRGMSPIDSFPEAARARIDALCVLPKPPPRWKLLGFPGDRRPLVAIPSRAWVEWHLRRGNDPYLQREKVPTTMRAAVIRRDGLTCRLCGDEVQSDDVHIDHVRPLSRGGRTVPANMQVAHSLCNIRKSNRWEDPSP